MRLVGCAGRLAERDDQGASDSAGQESSLQVPVMNACKRVLHVLSLSFPPSVQLYPNASQSGFAYRDKCGKPRLAFCARIHAVCGSSCCTTCKRRCFAKHAASCELPEHDQDVPRCFHAGDLARKNDDALSDDQLPPPPPKHHWVTQAREGTSSRDADLNASREAESTSGYKAKAKGEEGWEEGGEEERAASPFFAAGSSPAGKEGAREKFGELREVYCQVLGCGCMAPLLPLPFLSLSPPTKFCCSRVSLLFVPYYISLFHPSALLN